MDRNELDLKMMFYIFANQYGHVDMKRCGDWAKERLGITIPSYQVKITQVDIDELISHQRLPDTNVIFNRVKGKV